MAQLQRRLPTMIVTSSRIVSVGQRLSTRSLSSLPSLVPPHQATCNKNHPLHAKEGQQLKQQKYLVSSSSFINNNVTNLTSFSSSSIRASIKFIKDGFHADANSKRTFVSSTIPLLEYPSHQVVGLPSLSPTMESGSIASWNLKVGDSFGPGDSICSVETDKATVDFEAQDEGVIAQILVPAGAGEIKVGSPILVTVEDKADVGAFTNYTLVDAFSGTSAAAAPPPAPVTPPPSEPSPSPAAATVTSTPVSSPVAGERVVASPLAHLLAKEQGFNINDIVGTGPGGRIIAADVKEFVPSIATIATQTTTAPVAAVATPPTPVAVTTGAPTTILAPVIGSGYTDYPISESAKEVAARLAQSKRNVPHYYLTVDVCMDEVLKLRTMLNSTGKNEIGVYELIIKAAATSMKTVPAVNGSWLDSVVRVYDSVDVNVVVGSGDSLSTPVIRGCSTKGLKSISDELNDAINTTEVPSSLGTFTIINLGMYGIKSCAPIIREPQSCALAIGTLENRIVPAADGAESPYQQSVMVTCTLSCDHRVVDGAVGAQWLSTFKSHLENPTTLLL